MDFLFRWLPRYVGKWVFLGIFEFLIWDPRGGGGGKYFGYTFGGMERSWRLPIFFSIHMAW